MTSVELTGASFSLTLGAPNPGNRGTAMMTGQTNMWKRRLLALPVASSLALGGCISVKAPDKPIVIELNINIKQEVIYKLAADAGKTIDSNKEIF
ncbi:MAG: hypothetical protein NVS3B27_08170 [Novosphingobium sp.]|jgi:hypothetical protein